MTEYKIGTKEAVAIILSVAINHLILNLPKGVINNTGSSSILNVIFITIIAFGVVYLISQLMKIFPRLDILDISSFLGGKWLKIVIGILLLVYSIFTIGIMLRSFSEGLKIIFFPKTPVPVIMLLFLLAIVIANKLGFRSIARSNLFIMPIILLSILCIFIFNIKNFDITRMFPLFGNGFFTTFFSGISNIFVFSGIIYLYLIPPYLKEQADFSKIAYISIGFSAFFLIISVASLLLMFPLETTGEEIFPLYLASRYIEFGRFLQRLDAVFVLIWIISLTSYLSIALHFSTKIFQKITNLQNSKWFCSLFALIIFGFGLIPRNMHQVRFCENTIYQYIVIIFVFCICPGILLFANLKHLLREKKKGEVSLNETAL